MNRSLLIFALCAIAMSAQAGVYQCVDANGRLVFSDKGCAGDQKDRRATSASESHEGGSGRIDGSVSTSGPSSSSRPSSSGGTYGLTDRSQSNLKQNYTQTIERATPGDR